MLTYGRDSNNNVIPLLLDANGQVLVASSEPSAINPTGGFATYENLALTAGTNTLIIYTVPVGQRVRATYFYVRYVGVVAGLTMIPLFVQAGGSLVIAVLAPPVNAAYNTYNVDILLEEGSQFRCVLFGATAGDDFDATIALQRYK